MAGDDRDSEHGGRVRRIFASLEERLGGGKDLGVEARASLDRLRSAAEKRDKDALRAELEKAREEHGWLYKEMATHPDLASLVNELALWGF